jgi:hypothetical protein
MIVGSCPSGAVPRDLGDGPVPAEGPATWKEPDLMRTSDYHAPLTCADLPLDQKKLDDARDEEMDQLVHLLTHYFGCVQVRPAHGMGLEATLTDVLHGFAQRVASVISGAYTEEATATISARYFPGGMSAGDVHCSVIQRLQEVHFSMQLAIARGYRS